MLNSQTKDSDSQCRLIIQSIELLIAFVEKEMPLTLAFESVIPNYINYASLYKDNVTRGILSWKDNTLSENVLRKSLDYGLHAVPNFRAEEMLTKAYISVFNFFKKVLYVELHIE